MEDKKFSDLFSKDNDPNQKVFYNAIQKKDEKADDVVVTEELNLEEEVAPVKSSTPKSVTKPSTKMETQEEKDIDPLEYETADIPETEKKPTGNINAMSFSEGSRKYGNPDSMVITRNIFGQMRKPKVDVAMAEKIIPTLPKMKTYIDQNLQKLAVAQDKQDDAAIKEIEGKLTELYEAYTIGSLYNKYLTERGK